MSEAREHILARLRAQHMEAPPVPRADAAHSACDRERCIALFTERQQAVRGEVHRLGRAQWLNWVALELPRRGLQHLLAGTGDIGQQLQQIAIRGTTLKLYEQAIETWKPHLFTDVDVAVTSARCGIAETGSLVLWPDPQEPRLMSLVPPVHIALLDAEKIHSSLAEAMRAEDWSEQMPTNALLISGPSKTADIEQTLAYGIHGPKELITLILD